MSNTTITVDTSKLTGPLNAAVGAMAAVSHNLVEIKNILLTIAEHQIEVKNCLIHLHDSHLHNKPHTCEERFDVEYGKAILNTFINPVDLLIREFQTNLDCDGNGLIYGKDFIINNNDPECPQSLIHLSAIINKLPNQMTWEMYKSTLPDQLK